MILEDDPVDLCRATRGERPQHLQDEVEEGVGWGGWGSIGQLNGRPLLSSKMGRDRTWRKKKMTCRARDK